MGPLHVHAGDLPPLYDKFAAKSAQLGGKSYAYIAEGNGLHRTPKVLTSVEGRPYTLDEMSFGRVTEAVRRLPESDIRAWGWRLAFFDPHGLLHFFADPIDIAILLIVFLVPHA